MRGGRRCLPVQRIRWGAAVTVLAATGVVPTGPAASAPVPPAPVRPLSTPILSARRDPSWVDETLARQRLDRAVSGVTTAAFQSAKVPACVLVRQAGQDLFSLSPDTELLPASNEKLLTATAVLDTLGAGYRFTTEAAATARPAGGVLNGNLYLIGGGDPDLMTPAYDAGLYYPEPIYTSLQQLAASVKATGIRTVTGSVIGDGSRYDSLTAVPSWPPLYEAEGDVGPLGALEVNDGVPPPPAPGQPVPDGPAAPERSAAAIFTTALAAEGVKVQGPATAGRTPAGDLVLDRVESAPLGDEVEEMERVSDDTAAELFTKELGYRASGQGTTAAGMAVMRRDLAADGLPVGQWTGLDGSGLDRSDRATCRLLAGVLQQSGPSGVVAAGLPVADRTGTLTDRLAGTPAAGRVHAKTGTLIDVAALSGLLTPNGPAPTPRLGAPLYFSIIINGMPSAAGTPLTDRLAAAIAAYPQVVPLRELEPKP